MRSGARPSVGATAGASTEAATIVSVTSICTSSMAARASRGWVTAAPGFRLEPPVRGQLETFRRVQVQRHRQQPPAAAQVIPPHQQARRARFDAQHACAGGRHRERAHHLLRFGDALAAVFFHQAEDPGAAVVQVGQDAGGLGPHVDVHVHQRLVAFGRVAAGLDLQPGFTGLAAQLARQRRIGHHGAVRQAFEPRLLRVLHQLLQASPARPGSAAAVRWRP